MAKGRGQLSGIERLPVECDPIITWAAEELRDNKRTQTDIYKEFFQKLQALQSEYRGELEFTIPSFQAFNRYSIKLAELTRRLDETREIAGAIAGRFDAKASDDLTLIAGEAIKTLVFEIVTSAGKSGVDPKSAMNLASALVKAAQAQGVSTARRQKVEKDFKGKVDEAIDKVSDVLGQTQDGAAVLKKIREDIYGIFEK